MNRVLPRLLDLFCCAGGAGMGYHRAGFEVIGVDIADQPRYPFEWYKGDALDLLPDLIERYEPDAIHASPPCHDHTTLASLAGTDGTGWLLEATRDLLNATGLPWVIENVPGAPMRPDIVLCGEMFGLRTIRHRWFELGGWWAMSPSHPPHTAPTFTKQRRAALAAGHHISVTGDVGSHLGPAVMGIDWMTGNELSQAIPPAYTEYIGQQLIAALEVAA